jgi:predicted DNA-binding protein with PD1-like motif
MEVVSLVGNVSIKDGQPFTHIHVTLGKRDLSIVGGHFNDAVVHPNLEVWLRAESETVERTLDESCGLYLMDLSERA